MNNETPPDDRERMVPSLQRGELVYAEHVARYGFAAQLVLGLQVLDVACGTGYGGEILLSAGARSVVAVDYDADSVSYALKNRTSTSQAVVVGDAQSLPFKDASFDAVTSFETIEHLPDPAGFLRELRRVLVADGVLVLSTPNRLTSDGTNPFHLHEFAPEELLALLNESFKDVRLIPQSNWIASLVGTPSSQTWRTVGAIGGGADDLSRSEYLIAISRSGRGAGAISIAAPFDKAAEQLGPLKSAIAWLQEDRASWEDAAESYRARLLEFEAQALQPPQEAPPAPAPSKTDRASSFLAPEGSMRRKFCSSILRGLQMVRSTGPLSFLRHLIKVREWLPRMIHGKVAEPAPQEEAVDSVPDEADFPSLARQDLNRRYADWLKGLSQREPPNSAIRFGVVIAGGPDEALSRSVRQQTFAAPEQIWSWPDDVLKDGVSGVSHLIIVKAGGVLASSAFAEVARSFALHEHIDFVFSDEDRRNPDNTREDPYFKPGWSPDLLLSSDYISNVFACTTRLYREVLGSEQPPQSTYELVLRLTERARRVHHLPLPMYSRVSVHEEAGPEESREAESCLSDAVKRRGLDATVETTTRPGTFRVKRRLASQPRVSVIIPTRDKPGLLARCLDGLEQNGYSNLEVIVVDNGSVLEDTKRLLGSRPVRVLRMDAPFNFSMLVNKGAEIAGGEHLLLLNNDIEPVGPGWIEALLEHSQRDEVGAVGARLIHFDGTTRHEGVIVRPSSDRESPADHIDWNGYREFGSCTRDTSALTAACLMTRKSVFTQVGGFDESYRVAFGDVDYCLRLHGLGLRTIYTPHALLFHHESSTRRGWTPAEDVALFQERWGTYSDPYAPEGVRKVVRPYVPRTYDETAPVATAPLFEAPAYSAKESPRRRIADVDLEAFLGSGSRLKLPQSEHPVVSILIVLYNQAHLTYECLQRVRNTVEVPAEVIIVDNASTDRTADLLDRLEGARVVRNVANLHFLLAANQAAHLAKGRYLLFLNSDAYLTAGCVRSLVSTAESMPTAGVVGAKLIWPNGGLQEAGSIVWNDASIHMYGRGDDPALAPYNYVREVDYSSASCLLVRRDLFERLNRFDARFSPAYFEDVDLCFGIRSLGYSVIYQPSAVAIHEEHASAKLADAKSLIDQNRPKFAEKWADQLAAKLTPSLRNVWLGRDLSDEPRVLVIDDRIPAPERGAGYGRTLWMLELLAGLGYRVTFLPALDSSYGERAKALAQRGIEVLHGPFDTRQTLRDRRGAYDVVVVSRPHNAVELLPDLLRHFGSATLIYDAEALYSRREDVRLSLGAPGIDAQSVERLRLDESAIIGQADAVIAVSEEERAAISDYCDKSRVFVWSTVQPIRRPRESFPARNGLLFVGGFQSSPSPNEDAVLYFANDILPLVRQSIPDCFLTVVGFNVPDSIRALEPLGVRVIGFAPQLGRFFDSARIFVAPHRYAGGISLKVLEALGNGLPAVVSPIIATGLGLGDREQALVGGDPAAFAQRIIELHSSEELWLRLQSAGFGFVKNHHSPEEMRHRLGEIMRAAQRTVSKKYDLRAAQTAVALESLTSTTA